MLDVGARQRELGLGPWSRPDIGDVCCLASVACKAACAHEPIDIRRRLFRQVSDRCEFISAGGTAKRTSRCSGKARFMERSRNSPFHAPRLAHHAVPRLLVGH